MNRHPWQLTRPRTRGSAFVTVLLFTFLLLTLVASILKWSLSERQLNIRASYWLEARNAAEAVAEYGFSQIATQFSSHANPPSFDPAGVSPLVLPPTHSPLQSGDFFYGSHVDPSSLEIIGGVFQSIPSSGALYFVDPNDANNANDTLAGQYVYRRDIRVLAKATVNPPNGGTPVTAYVTEVVSVRGAPLFANAIFYSNNDLEIFPGPQMDVYGPVHCNGNMFVSNQSNSTGLRFHGPVSLSGNIYHAWANTAAASQGNGQGSGESLGTNPVTFITSSSSNVNMKNGANVWCDSTMGSDSTLFNASGHYYDTSTAALTQLEAKVTANFRQYASQTWGGNLQTSAMGVAAYNPVGSGGQVGVDGSGNAILANEGSVDSHGTVIDPYAGDPLGYGPHSIIDPPNASLTTSDPYYDAKHEVESQKYSNQAGLYVKVEVTPGNDGAPDAAVVKLFSWPGSAAAAGVTDPAQIGPNGGLLLKTYNLGTGGSMTSGLVKWVPFQATVVAGTTTGTGNATSYTAVGPVGGKYAIRTTTTTGCTLTQSGTGTLNGSGSLSDVSGGSVSFTGGSSTSSTGAYTYTSSSSALNAAPGHGAATGTFTSDTTNTVTGTSSANVTQGMYDQRQLSGINMVQLDMSVLRAALADTNSGSNSDSKAIVDASDHVWGHGTSGGYNQLVSNSTGWNGAVYVQISKSDGTAANQTSVAIANGKVASGSGLVPAVNDVGGLTVATNAPMYVVGLLNADGSVATSSSTTPDDGRTDAIGTPTSAEVPVALAADAITILSPNYFADASGSSTGSTVPTTNADNSRNAYKSASTVDPTASATSTEVAAAFITGLVPTSSGASSGGAHNLPRFLEDWGSKTVAIRGSLVSLYRSKIATGPWAIRYYGAPTRNWGFDVIFQNGHFPPLTPKVMSYRRVDFSDLSYNDMVRGTVTIRGYQWWRHYMWPGSF